MHRGAILTDRHHKHRVSESLPEHGMRETLSARGMGPFPDPYGQYAIRQGENIAALQILLAPPVDPLDAAEARMKGVDEVSQLRFTPTCWHRQGGDRHTVADPDTRVPS